MTVAGWKATMAEISNPIRTLYPKLGLEYFKEKKRQHQYYYKK